MLKKFKPNTNNNKQQKIRWKPSNVRSEGAIEPPYWISVTIAMPKSTNNKKTNTKEEGNYRKIFK